MTFASFFRQATGNSPYPYQEKLGTQPILSCLIDVPTGAGKTAGALLAWLWHRKVDPANAPRRIVYCLPMRVLVEQTRDKAEEWVKSLRSTIWPDLDVEVYTLMGGEVEEDWELYPERPAVLVGSQDMLLSRALNRGYAMSRYQWPVHFGLLNNDCLWICDEVQLMGSGLATTTQLLAFRERFGVFGPTPTWWMSATMDPDWLRTVDSKGTGELPLLTLEPADLADRRLSRVIKATKKLDPAPAECHKPEGLARFVKETHTSGSQTLVVVNRVDRARQTFDSLRRLYHTRFNVGGKKPSTEAEHDLAAPEIHLLHSRFRPYERRVWQKLLEQAPKGAGRIIVSTQVIEAGVDITSLLLVSDLAPYSSMVQRFGRCNRTGESNDAQIFWVDRPLEEKQAKLSGAAELSDEERDEIALPYRWQELERAASVLGNLNSARPSDLPRPTGPSSTRWVIRRRDLIDLFDTTKDLSGYDIDISRFIRDDQEREVLVAWRDVDEAGPTAQTSAPDPEELCPVPIGGLRDFLKNPSRAKAPCVAWTWSALDGFWEKIGAGDAGRLRPGMVLLVNAAAGGYDPNRGWDPESTTRVPGVASPAGSQPEEGMDDEPLSFRSYTQTLRAHSQEVAAETDAVLNNLPNIELGEARGDLLFAALHHDLGKAHPVFQRTLRQLEPTETSGPSLLLAKSQRRGRHDRPHFRHELASALAILQMGGSDLAAYLAASHHGKVRLSIRALPGELKPSRPGVRFARGLHEGDALPAVDLGNGAQIPEIVLNLEPMLLGRGSSNQASWLDRMISLRDDLGAFRLAYLEALIRVADERASANPKETL